VKATGVEPLFSRECEPLNPVFEKLSKVQNTERKTIHEIEMVAPTGFEPVFQP
jgi:hypothetical protein